MPLMNIPALLILCILCATLPSCSQSDVAARQGSITSAQDDVLANRATRLKARDDRMWAARSVWMQ